MTAPEILQLGEKALTIRVSSTLSAEVNLRVRALANAIASASLEGVSDVVPANSSVGVYFRQASYASEARPKLEEIIARPIDSKIESASLLHRIPVVYDGPDIEAVANACSLSVPEVIQIHQSIEYSVFAIGFAPGFAYLGELDVRISVPRRAQPRTRVPAGSVAIANRQTAIYPLNTPGGWNLIGSTMTDVFDICRAGPSLFSVGDRVRFVPA